jgi:CheY-like chemotaxis protein
MRRPRAGGCVLLVEDYDDCRELYAEALHEAGLGVLEAQDGAEGVAKALQYQPDLIIMDLFLPRMRGDEALRCLREDSRTRGISALLLTAHAAEVADPWSLECDLLVAKPCLPRRLITLVFRMLAASSGGTWPKSRGAA